MPAPSFFWYDYETFGTDPRSDRIAQFAGIRTDMDFNIIDEPIDIFCRASNDILPHPEACLVTGITPQKTQHGLIEAEFMARINEQFAIPNTCVTGFNNIRFDDEFTRYGLYRNFFDPYAREWQNGCSRWDIIDLVRITRALRPEGINWPVDDDGKPSNRLELITRDNSISHESAHDALSDVRATIAVAKLIRQKQPKLFDFVFQNKSKQKVSQILNLRNPQPVLHTSGMYSSEICNTAMVYPLAQHPTNANGIVVFDLRYSPDELINLPVPDIVERLYTATAQLPEGVERIPLKTIHINKCPVVAPLSTLDDASAERTLIDREQHQQHLEALKAAASGLKEKCRQVLSHNSFPTETDPDRSLYSGGFFSPDDRQRMDQIRQMEPQQLATAGFNFDDERIPEMLFRYRARNYPQSLNDEERKQWNAYRRERFSQKDNGSLAYEEYMHSLDEHLANPQLTEAQKQMLNELKQWGQQLGEELSLA